MSSYVQTNLQDRNRNGPGAFRTCLYPVRGRSPAIDWGPVCRPLSKEIDIVTYIEACDSTSSYAILQEIEERTLLI